MNEAPRAGRTVGTSNSAGNPPRRRWVRGCVLRSSRYHRMRFGRSGRRRGNSGAGSAQPAAQHPRRVGRQPRRMVRLVRLFGVRAVFRPRFLPQGRPDRAIAPDRGGVRGRLRDATDRRLGDGHLRRPQGAQGRADFVSVADVRRLAADRGRSDLCPGRIVVARDPAPRAAHPGAQPGRRIWLERDLSERDGRPRPPRLLVELPICDDHRRATERTRAARRAAICAGRHGDAGMGLADRLSTPGRRWQWWCSSSAASSTRP